MMNYDHDAAAAAKVFLSVVSAIFSTMIVLVLEEVR